MVGLRHKVFDSTLGYPSEGPECGVCRGGNGYCVCSRVSSRRMAPYGRPAVAPAGAVVRNTFIETSDGQPPRRQLRITASDPVTTVQPDHESDISASLEDLALNPQNRMDQDAGIPHAELRRRELSAAAAGTSSASSSSAAPAAAPAAAGTSHQFLICCPSRRR